MAASFKQQCPSCEAMVLVKDPKQIGKKIDCPRCKYRFVAEAPAEAEEAAGEEEIQDEGKSKPKATQAVTAKKPGPAPAAPTIRKKAGPRKADEEDAAKPKKKKQQSSGSMVLVLGVGMSLCAVALLGVGGYFIFLAPKDQPQRSGRLTAPRFTRPGQDTAPKKAVGPVLVEMTNLLPSDTQGILNLNLKGIVHGAVGSSAFQTPGGFRPEFIERRVGLKKEEVDRVLVAQNFSKGWVFAVIRTSKPISLPALQKTLDLKIPPGGGIKGQDYYTAAPSEWLEHLGQILEGFYPALKLVPSMRVRTPAIRLVDTHTLVIADLEPLKEFLDASEKAKPDGTKEPQPKATAGKTYGNVNPELKKLMEQMEQGHSALVSFAWETGPIQKNMELAAGMLKPTGLPDEKVIDLLRQLSVVGASLHLGEKMTMAFGLGGKAENFAKSAVQQLRSQAEAIRQNGSIDSSQVQITLDGKPLSPSPAGQVPKEANVPAADMKVLVRTARADKILVLNAEFQFNMDIRETVLKFLQPRMLVLRGIADMVDAPSRMHELAAAAMALAAKGGYPRGTYDRPIDVKRLGRLYPPGERVSWMAELLPHLGYESVYQRIKFSDSWKSQPNAVPGSVLVPAFLDSRSPPNSWWVQLPHLGGRSYGATHFVGIAGVGLDAADYAAGDPAVANKLGVLGYDRKIGLADIKDGTANTILMLQMPPTYQRPWIAGGGATLMGVPEKNSIRPFVGTHDGKRGTYAIMADGSVRFISAQISDEAFKAMCTINGGDKVDVDVDAPKVPGGGAELKAQPPPNGKQ